MPEPRFDVLTMGRSSIDLYAHEIGVPLPEVTSFDAYVGGCPTNISVGARRLGLRSALLTALGDDQVGDFVLNFLEREGVETRFIPRKPGHRTSAVIMSIQPPDRFPLTFYRDNCADRELTIADVDHAPLTDAAILVASGTGLSHEPARGATMYAAARARAASTTVIVDIDYRPDQWVDRKTFASALQSLLRHAHIALGTEEEIAAAMDVENVALDAAAAWLLKSGPSTLVVKRGKAGSRVYSTDGSPIDVPPFPVKILNVLGAGDAFASGFIYGLRQGWPYARAARVGNATGAIVVTRHGCANFMPTWNEVESFVARKGGWQWESVA
jgi:5-dehydro-2-deoxygluconokinase